MVTVGAMAACKQHAATESRPTSLPYPLTPRTMAGRGVPSLTTNQFWSLALRWRGGQRWRCSSAGHPGEGRSGSTPLQASPHEALL